LNVIDIDSVAVIRSIDHSYPLDQRRTGDAVEDAVVPWNRGHKRAGDHTNMQLIEDVGCDDIVAGVEEGHEGRLRV